MFKKWLMIAGNISRSLNEIGNFECPLVKREEAFYHMGYFRIEYQYFPLN